MKKITSILMILVLVAGMLFALPSGVVAAGNQFILIRHIEWRYSDHNILFHVIFDKPIKFIEISFTGTIYSVDFFENNNTYEATALEESYTKINGDDSRGVWEFNGSIPTSRYLRIFTNVQANDWGNYKFVITFTAEDGSVQTIDINEKRAFFRMPGERIQIYYEEDITWPYISKISGFPITLYDFVSENPNIADFDPEDSNYVIAKKPGITNFVGTAKDGSGLTYTVAVQVGNDEPAYGIMDNFLQSLLNYIVMLLSWLSNLI